MTIDTVFYAFSYFYSDIIEQLIAVAFLFVFVLIILYYTNR